MTASSADFKVDVKDCARCQEDHLNLEFSKLRIPSNSWTHWASCPNTMEPIMLKLVVLDEPEVVA
jgi:hypothetical protein